MDYSKNQKYFKSSDTHFYIGIAVLAVGAILALLSWLFWIFLFPYQPIVGFLVAVLGAAIAWVPSSLRSNEKDLDHDVASETEKYAEEVMEKLGLSKSAIGNLRPMVIGGYNFDSEEILFRRGKNDRKFRSSLYTAAALIFTKTGICISEKRFSLTENFASEKVTEFLYADLDGASVVEEERCLAKRDTVKLFWFILTADGKEALRVPVTPSAMMDKICDDIQYAISQKKASANL